MSQQESKAKWLLNELSLWRQEGIIDDKCQKKLQALYSKPKEAHSNLLIVIFASLASLLIGVGVISIFATNWDMFSRQTKIVLSFVPLVVGVGLFLFTSIRKVDSLAWKESTSGFLMLAFAASLGLISQIYHNGGTMQDFLTVWLLCSLPLVYIFKSYLSFLIYSVFAIGLGVSTIGDNTLVQSWLIPMGVIPYYIFQLTKQTSENKTIVSGWVLTLGFGGLLFANFWEAYGFLLLMMSTLASMLYVIGKYFHGNQTNILKQPMQLLSYLTVIILSFMLTFISVTEELMDEMVDDYFRVDFEVGDVYYLLGLGFFAIVIGCFLSSILHQKMKINWFIVISPLLFMVMLGFQEATSLVVVVMFIVFLFSLGIHLVGQGVQQKKMLKLNVGMLLISAIVLTKFFEVDIPLTMKGIVSVFIGVGFLVANVGLSKQVIKTNKKV